MDSENVLITNTDIQEILLLGLKTKYIGKFLEGRKIIDIKTEIQEREYHTNWGGGYYTELIINFLTESPTGRTKTWKRVI